MHLMYFTEQPMSAYDASVLRTMLASIRERQAVEIRYQSLSGSRPQAVWRWVSPHAIAYDGHRWHARAFCHIDRAFKDFLLPRILKTRATGLAEASPTDDIAWHQIVTVTLKPHPGLSDKQKHVVGQDFGMRGGHLGVQVRLALLYYLLKRLNLDFEEESRSAREQHVVLAEPNEVRRLLKQADIRSAAPGGNALHSEEIASDQQAVT